MYYHSLAEPFKSSCLLIKRKYNIDRLLPSFFTLVILLVFPPVINKAYSDSHTWAFSSNYLQADLNGFLQTPAGGNIGSTTFQRPTLSELNFDKTDIQELAFSNDNGKRQLYFGWHRIRIAEQAILQEYLISQFRSFYANEAVQSRVKLDWYRAGYQYHFYPSFGRYPLRLSIASDIAMFDFSYTLRSNTARANRSYAKVGMRVGGEAQVDINQHLQLYGLIYDSIPIPNQPAIASTEIGLKLYILRHNNRSVSINASLGRQFIDYKDEQPVPNHIRAELDNLGKVGLLYRF